jgi:prefoldin subunit 5
MFNEKLTSLNAEKQRLNSLVQDFDASTSQWTEDIVNELNFTLHLRQRFTDGGREKKLEILHRLGQTIELTDGVLDFRMKQTFITLAQGKLDMQRALGAIQPISTLEKPLVEVDSRTFKKVELVWSG